MGAALGKGKRQGSGKARERGGVTKAFAALPTQVTGARLEL